MKKDYSLPSGFRQCQIRTKYNYIGIRIFDRIVKHLFDRIDQWKTNFTKDFIWNKINALPHKHTSMHQKEEENRKNVHNLGIRYWENHFYKFKEEILIHKIFNFCITIYLKKSILNFLDDSFILSAIGYWESFTHCSSLFAECKNELLKRNEYELSW